MLLGIDRLDADLHVLIRLPADRDMEPRLVLVAMNNLSGHDSPSLPNKAHHGPLPRITRAREKVA